METTVFVVRTGVTDWHRDRKVLGHRDIDLNAEGVAQAQAVADALSHASIGEIIASPLNRAVQMAEVMASKLGGHITRDARLTDCRVGRWEAMAYADVRALPEYQQFVSDPFNAKLPGGEDLGQVRDRVVGAVGQALRDAPAGEALAIVTHAGPCRVLLAHFLGMDVKLYHHLDILPGSLSLLSFRDDREPPRVRTLGWLPSFKEIV